GAGRYEAKIGTHLLGDPRVVAGHDLDLDAEAGQTTERLLGRHLRRIEEREEPGELEIVFVLRADLLQAGSSPGRHGHDAGPGAELGLQELFRFGWDRSAPFEDAFGRPLGDEQAVAAVTLHESGCHAP